MANQIKKIEANAIRNNIPIPFEGSFGHHANGTASAMLKN